jgi:hypothetical protein
MDMEHERQHPQSHLFTLRLWEEALDEGKAEWRGRVQELASGETAFFRDWPGLVATLSRLIAKSAAAAEVVPSGSQRADEVDALESVEGYCQGTLDVV